MAVTPSYREYVLEQLAGLGRVRSLRMFGGVGLYCDDLFFALIAGDTLYLKTDDGNRGDFMGRGMGPFRPFRNKPLWEMSYFEVPADVLEDAEAMKAWARKSLCAARASTPRQLSRKPPRTRKDI
jgi:DNA transformation protein